MTASGELAGMRRAIVLSAFGLGTTSPNPPVGCVVFDAAGRIVGEGYHVRKGEAHAETRALAMAGEAARGGTVVVTLEPCNHAGRTPPCREALVDAGVTRVVIAALDPTSRGAGGAAELRRAGVSVEIGLCEQEARHVLGGWLTALETARPAITWTYDAHVGPRDRWRLAGPSREHISDLRAGKDVLLYEGGRIEEGVPGGHGKDVFTLPRGPLPADPRDLLPLLAAGGARTVLLAGDERLADPFLARGLIDDVVAYIDLVDDTPTSSLPDPPASLGLPADFHIVDLTRTRSGVRIKATAATN